MLTDGGEHHFDFSLGSLFFPAEHPSYFPRAGGGVKFQSHPGISTRGLALEGLRDYSYTLELQSGKQLQSHQRLPQYLASTDGHKGLSRVATFPPKHLPLPVALSENHHQSHAEMEGK